MTLFFAGLDVSTQSCKLVIINVQDRQVVFTYTVNYDTALPHYNTKNGTLTGLPAGVSESNPYMWIDAVNRTFEEAVQAGIPMHSIACIAVSGQQHGLVALDSHGNLSRHRSKLWNDFSTQEECDILNRKVGGVDRMIREIGNTQRTGYTAGKIFHMLRHEPEIYHTSETFFLVHNYINWYLTGGVKVMEYGDTSGMALWNPKTRQWSKKVINAIDPALIHKLPQVRPPDQSIGNISTHLVQKFGFSPKCRIDAGSGDNMYSAIGTGNIEPGIVTISLGTSGTAYTFMEDPYIDPSGEIACFCDSTGHYLPLLCVSNLANGYNQILNQFNLNHDDFNEVIRKSCPGNGGRILLPWYEGERTPDLPLAAPLYFGFRTDEFTLEILCRAVLEGHILNLYDGFKKMDIKVKEIRLTGGLSNSDAWCQGIADIFESDTVPVKGEGAALGAAIHAAWVWYKENDDAYSLKDLTDAFVIPEKNRKKKPIPEHVTVYRHLKNLFASLSLRIRGYKADDPFKLRAEYFT
ncbi:TPA: hypothetical protein DCG86_07045 [Candidatus Marinimicrobia bacterium]|nr:MAG: Xylulokinase [Marinimicrobia bacterium 46_47]KUK93389.1 MAG: Xylulokinase [Marinimicrobia bacterium 46_43]HAE87763.1 hypothetical protein [Candidatus Neomarinimicrobiota bacterium]HBY18821.1 hypothetical protein [Candidatus Neomarinimicrobiota bacterium]